MKCHQHQLILRTAVHYLRTTVKADRAIAIYDGLGYSHGFEQGALWNKADLSQGIIEELLARKQPALVPDALTHPDFSHRTSTVLSNIGAVLFLPIRDAGGVMRGFLYLDQTRQSRHLMTNAILKRIQGYVTDTLQPMLHSLRQDLSWQETLQVEWLAPPDCDPSPEELAEHSGMSS